jgi:hypothetical protein
MNYALMNGEGKAMFIKGEIPALKTHKRLLTRASLVTLSLFFIVAIPSLISPRIASAAMGWSPMYIPAGQLYGVWGSSSSDVFVVGAGGAVWRYNGSTWNSMDSGTNAELRGLWGTSSSDIFAVGEGGTIIHYDGSQWSSMDSGTVENLYGVWGSSGDDVIAVGHDYTVLHYDGVSWGPLSPNPSINYFWGIWGSSSNEVFAIGGGVGHYNGVSWTTYSEAGGYDVWATSETDVFTASSHTVMHYDGSSWNSISDNYLDNVRSIWGNSSTDVFALGLSLYHYNGNTWRRMYSGVDAGFIYDAWGTSGTDVFAVGYGTILHYSGSPAPSEQISEILFFFNESVEDKTIKAKIPKRIRETGDRKLIKKTKRRRIRKIIKLLEETQQLINDGFITAAHGVLEDAYVRCDGQKEPLKDWLKGSNLSNLADMIQWLKTDLESQ